jgi:hypothetical protein
MVKRKCLRCRYLFAVKAAEGKSNSYLPRLRAVAAA